MQETTIPVDVSGKLKQVEGFLAEGYQRMKAKIMPGFDIELIAAVRKEFGDLPLMTDAVEHPHLSGREHPHARGRPLSMCPWDSPFVALMESNSLFRYSSRESFYSTRKKDGLT